MKWSAASVSSKRVDLSAVCGVFFCGKAVRERGEGEGGGGAGAGAGAK